MLFTLRHMPESHAKATIATARHTPSDLVGQSAVFSVAAVAQQSQEEPKIRCQTHEMSVMYANLCSCVLVELNLQPRLMICPNAVRCLLLPLPCSGLLPACSMRPAATAAA